MLPSRLVRCLFGLLAGVCVSHAQNLWRPVEPEELALKAPKVEKDADAEVLFWDVHVSYELQSDYPQTVLMHYLRIKVFTERGRDQQSTVSIPYMGKTHISDISGHTIKPDGTVLDLKRDAVFDKDVIKAGGLKVKSKSFAMPGVEPGSIIEYRWKEVHSEQIANYLRLYFQRDIPVEQVTYHLKPLVHWAFPYGLRTASFQANPSRLIKESDGYYATSQTNVPAYRPEPDMPPEDQVRSWMLIYYSEDKKLEPEKYWREVGRETYTRVKPLLKVNGDVKRISAEVIGDASTPEQKIEKLFRYCRTNLKNLYAEGTSAEERLDAKVNKSPADTLKQGAGTSRDINLAFAALATAAGFDARYAKMADRGDAFFDQRFPDDYFLRTYNIAVRVGDNWKFFDPGSSQIPFGMLRWQEEGVSALVTDPKDPVFVTTPQTPAEKSLQKRTGLFKLDADGTLEGEVKVTFTGHEAISRRAYRVGESAAERENQLTEELKQRFGAVEITNVAFDNVDKIDEPLVYRYHIKVPGYAQRTGKRLFLQMGYFERNFAPRFPNAQRRYDVYFPHPWSEQDTVSVQLPDGYELDHAEAPHNFTFGEVGGYEVSVGLTPDHRLIYQRKLTMGKGGQVLYPQKVYPALKSVFDRVHEEDAHTITLKQSGPSAAPATSAKKVSDGQ